MIVHETLKAAINHRSPIVVAPITNHQTLSYASTANLASECDMVELRLDGLLNDLDDAKKFSETCPLPLLITARHPDEGGEGQLSTAQRLELYLDFLPFAAAIDIEIQSLPDLLQIAEKAHGQGTALVASVHDFAGMPPRSALDSLASAATDANAILKIAATPKTLDDVFTLAHIAEKSSPTQPVSAMGMGKFGRLSRLACAQAGSVLNYGYLSTPNAPGQWPAAHLKTLIAQLLE